MTRLPARKPGRVAEAIVLLDSPIGIPVEKEKIMKRLTAILLCIVLVACLTACGQSKPAGTTAGGSETSASSAPQGPVAMTDEEKDLVAALKDDTTTLTDDDYITQVAEILYHTADQTGKVYELEGVLGVDGENKTVYRTLVNGSEKTTLALPLRYADKDIAAGAWIHVVGVVAADDSGASVLDVVAMESLAKAGNAELSWAGGELHQH